MPTYNVMIVEPCRALAQDLAKILTAAGFRVQSACDLRAVAAVLYKNGTDLVILGPSTVGPANSVELAKDIRNVCAGTFLLLVTDRSSEELAISALRSGINEYVKYPFEEQHFLAAVGSCIARRGQNMRTHATTQFVHTRPPMIGSSSVMRELRERLTRLGSSDTNILITGETGTGKELAATLLHSSSRRCNRPMLTINCAAIPDSLFESELFGHERGAFTGAQERRNGKMRWADGGTVFLDEIGDMSAYGQAKMLRIIEDGEIQRLGRDELMAVDVRIIAATNKLLEQLIEGGQFRSDLYFRLNVARVQLPALRHRKEDLPELIDHYVHHFNHRFGRKVTRLSDETVACFLAYDWPGNVRELKNCLETIFVESTGPDTSIACLTGEMKARFAQSQLTSCDERTQIIAALAETNWNKSKAADKLNWSRMTLYRKIARYNVAAR